MQNDNSTPMSAQEYDEKISNTIPYYLDFHAQTISVVKNMCFGCVDWLDLGCGTGTLAAKAAQGFEDIKFTMVDPSEKMLRKAREQNYCLQASYICTDSESINFHDQFDVVTAIQSHHYMVAVAREKATKNAYDALRNGGIYITFENVIPETDEIKNLELRRWGTYQKEHGKSDDEVKEHLARCGVNYFPLTIGKHIDLLKKVGFDKVHVFWYSYMQAGIYAIK